MPVVEEESREERNLTLMMPQLYTSMICMEWNTLLVTFRAFELLASPLTCGDVAVTL